MRLTTAVQVALLSVALCAAMTALVLGTFPHDTARITVDLLWSLAGFCGGFMYALSLTTSRAERKDLRGPSKGER